MSRALPIVSLCVALLALGLALAPRGEPPPPPPPPQTDGRLGDDVLELRKRVELLEDDSRNLWDRVVLLERRGVAVAAGDAGGDVALLNEVLRLRDEVRALSAGPALANDAGRAALADLVREVQAEQARERAQERVAFRQQRASEFASKWKTFISDAQLSSGQKSVLEERLKLEETARRAAFDRADGTFPTPDEMRALASQRRETDKLMKDQLEPAQYEAFQTLRRDERGGRGNRGGDRDPR